MRQPQAGAVREARTGALTGRSVARTLLVAAAIGLFLSFVGAFGTGGTPALPRTVVMVAISCFGAALGMTSFHLTSLIPGVAARLWLNALVGAVAMTGPMTLFVWWITGVFAPTGPLVHELPGYLFYSAIMCVVMTFVAVFASARQVVVVVEQAPAPPPKFLERLPLKLRGAEIWAVEAEDHYLRLHTSKGQDLILLRLADAVAELEGVEGVQVHRSWWVARDAIADARRGDGRATLVLKDGSEVPVSRTYAKVIRDLGWI